MRTQAIEDEGLREEAQRHEWIGAYGKDTGKRMRFKARINRPLLSYSAMIIFGTILLSAFSSFSDLNARFLKRHINFGEH